MPDIFDDDNFPGYDKINISWNELSRVGQGFFGNRRRGLYAYMGPSRDMITTQSTQEDLRILFNPLSA